MAYCEGHYAARSEPSDEMFRCGDYLVQKRCPHLRADLERFGTVEDGILECKVHHWQFDLETRALPHVGRRRAPAAHDPDRPTPDARS